jgi:hypothetical protein
MHAPKADRCWISRVVIIAVLASVLNLAQAWSKPCVATVGDWPFGPAEAVAAVGSTVYFGSGSALVVADVSIPDQPQILGSVGLGGKVSEIAVCGHLAAVLLADRGVSVVDVADPAAPVEVAFLPAGAESPFKGVALSDGRLCLLGSEGTLYVLDLSVPSEPIWEGTWQSPGSCLNVTMAGSLAYVAVDDLHAPGLYVLDLAEPAAPLEVGFAPFGVGSGSEVAAARTACSIEGLTVSGDEIYVAEGDCGFQVFQPLSPCADPSPVELLVR